MSPFDYMYFCIVEIYRYRKLYEIGVHNGGSMSMVIAGEQNVNLYGIDLFEDICDKTKHFNDE